MRGRAIHFSMDIATRREELAGLVLQYRNRYQHMIGNFMADLSRMVEMTESHRHQIVQQTGGIQLPATRPTTVKPDDD